MPIPISFQAFSLNKSLSIYSIRSIASSDMVLNLYGASKTTCTARVMACLLEKGVEFEVVEVNLFTGEHKQQPYISKNPFALLPALEDEDVSLFESRAITWYVANKYREKGTDLLRLDNLKESALVNVWIEVESRHYNAPIAAIVYESVIAPLYDLTTNEEIIETNAEKLGKVLDVYEERLSKSKYLAGNLFTLADLHHIPYTFLMMKTPKADLINSRPHVKAWWEDISTRPALKTVIDNLNAV